MSAVNPETVTYEGSNRHLLDWVWTPDEPPEKSKQKATRKIWSTIDAPVSVAGIAALDPGTANLGLALGIPDMPGVIQAYYMTLREGDFSVGTGDNQEEETMFELARKLSSLGEFQLYVVEGAAYKKAHGQVELESIRTAFRLAGWTQQIKTMTVPPATVRKTVLGHGKAHPTRVWPDLNPNTADAVATLLYASGYIWTET